MRVRRRRVLVVVTAAAAVAAAALVGRVAYLARDLSPTRETRRTGCFEETESRDRSREFLPPREWGFGRWSCIGCGAEVTIRTEFRKLGFVTVVDTWKTTYRPVPGPGCG